MMEHNHWIEIDLDAILHNLNTVQSYLAEEVKLLAVVKADAYGLGAGPIGRLFEEQGVGMLGVTNLTEGINLRQEGISLPILLFAPLLPAEALEAVNYQLTPTVATEETLKKLAEALRPGDNFPLHIKVDTGMGRTGLQPEDVVGFCSLIKENYPQLYIEGIFTHFAQGAAGDNYTQEQLKTFQRVIAELDRENIRIPLKHAANSIAILELPETHFDMVRGGTILYGQYPSGFKGKIALKNPWRPKARILHIHNLASGDSVGYGRDYKTKKATRIGVIPIGYADGLGISAIARPKNLLDLLKSLAKIFLAYWGKGPQALKVDFQGSFLPFVGRLGMQLSMIEIGELPIEAGDVVAVPLGRITANPCLPRVYLRQNQVVAERNMTWATLDLTVRKYGNIGD